MTILIIRQTNPANPAALCIDKRHRPEEPRPGQNPLPRTNARRSRLRQNAPHPKGNSVVARQAHLPPSMTGLSASPNDPSAPSPNLPIQPADPMQTQFGPADPRHCQTSPTGWVAAGWADLSPALAAPNKHPCPKGTSLPS